ncbi:hypothetical protein A45J_2424 [hot springs metagenome]|uniref:Uncharacterized protein n=1 Tax=hot springs metagenome TaxID=433727 RepID=A0A5J4L6Y3_9ZZZZ
MALKANVSGNVIAIVNRETEGGNGKEKKRYREVHIVQRADDGTPEKYKIKVWNPTIEIKENSNVTFSCSIRSWGMKDITGSYKHGIDISVPNKKI